MGKGAKRSLERVAAAIGELEPAPIEFQATCDVAFGAPSTPGCPGKTITKMPAVRMWTRSLPVGASSICTRLAVFAASRN